MASSSRGTHDDQPLGPEIEGLASLARDFAARHPGEVARLLAGLSPRDVSAFLETCASSVAAGVARLMTAQELAACLPHIDGESLAPLLEAMPRDQIACSLRRLPVEDRERILGLLPQAAGRALTAVLRYEEDSAGALMEPVILTLPVAVDVASALDIVRRNSAHLRYFVYVVDKEERLVGVLDLRTLMTASPEAPLASIMQTEVERLSASSEREAILRHPGWERFHSLPVIDAHNVLIGVLRYETLQRLLRGDRATPLEGASAMIALSELFWIGSQRVLGELANLVTAGGSHESKP